MSAVEEEVNIKTDFFLNSISDISIFNNKMS